MIANELDFQFVEQSVASGLSARSREVNDEKTSKASFGEDSHERSEC
jgi:hypothetical protein